MTINETVEKEKAIAKKNNPSPRPTALLNLVLSLNIEYKYTIKSNRETKNKFIITDTKKSSESVS